MAKPRPTVARTRHDDADSHNRTGADNGDGTAPSRVSTDGSPVGAVRAVRGHPGLVALASALAGLAALLVALLAAGGAPAAPLPGIPGPGALTGWGLPVAKLVFDISAVATVGTLLTAVVLSPSPTVGLHPVQGRALAAAFWTASAWALSAVAAAVFTLSDVADMPVGQLLSAGPAVFWQGLDVVPLAAALLLTAVAAVAIAASAPWTTTPAGGARVLVLAVLALTPTLFTGHAATASQHDVATTSLVVHVVAASLWVGGLVGLVLYLRTSGPVLATATTRYSALALGCFVLVAGSGLLNAWTRLGFSLDAWASGYGALVLVKAAALVALGMLGWAHRSRTLPGLHGGQPRAFLRLAVVELALMATTVGVAVALGRTPTTTSSAAAARTPSHGAGHATLPQTLAPFTPPKLLTEWRPDAVALALAALALVAYVRALLTLRRHGRQWPASRTAAFVAGLAVAVLATSGGLAVYAPALLSVHLGRFLALGLLAPALLCLGAPLTLSRRVRELDSTSSARPVAAALVPPRLLRTVADPINGLAGFVAVLYALYATPLLAVSLRSVQGILVANAATFLAGAALLWPVLARDRFSGARPRDLRLAVSAVLFVALGSLALYSLTWPNLLGVSWFGTLQFDWSDPATDQRRGAQVLAVAAVLGLAVVLTVMARFKVRPAQPPVDSSTR